MLLDCRRMVGCMD